MRKIPKSYRSIGNEYADLPAQEFSLPLSGFFMPERYGPDSSPEPYRKKSTSPPKLTVSPSEVMDGMYELLNKGKKRIVLGHESAAERVLHISADAYQYLEFSKDGIVDAKDIKNALQNIKTDQT